MSIKIARGDVPDAPEGVSPMPAYPSRSKESANSVEGRAEEATTPRHAADAQLLTFEQRKQAIPLSAYYYSRVHPFVIAAANVTVQIERPKLMRRRPSGRRQDPRIDEACARFGKGLKSIDDYDDLLTPNTRGRKRKSSYGPLMSSARKSKAKAKMLAKVRQDAMSRGLGEVEIIALRRAMLER